MQKNTDHHQRPERAPASSESGPGYELRDISTRLVVKVATGLLVLTLLALALSWGFERFMSRRLESAQRPVSPLASTLPELPPEPRLQVMPRVDLQQVRAQEAAILNNYAWIDQKSGVVRIPIERAMELIAERGLPTRPLAEGAGAPKRPEPRAGEKARNRER